MVSDFNRQKGNPTVGEIKKKKKLDIERVER